jgi:uncharacterized membrane protein (UPF0127 family)
MENISVIKGKKRLHIDVSKKGFLSRGIGLTFKTRNTKNLLFEFRKDTREPLTALFVFFPFLVLWLDKGNRIIDYRFVRPFKLHINTKKRFRKIIEIPINEKNKVILSFFDDKFKNF